MSALVQVEDLELSVRATRTLQNAGISTLAQLQELDLRAFQRKYSGVGSKTINELRAVLSYRAEMGRATQDDQIMDWARAHRATMLGLMRGELDVCLRVEREPYNEPRD